MTILSLLVAYYVVVSAYALTSKTRARRARRRALAARYGRQFFHD